VSVTFMDAFKYFMKKTFILLGFLALLFAGRYVGLYECSAAKFEYQRIESTMYDNDWKGSEYSVLELNSYKIWYEQALIDFLPKEEELLAQVTDSLLHFALDLNLDKYRFIKSGGDVQLCLSNMDIQIEKMESGIFENEYDVFIDSDFEYYVSHENGIQLADDYGFKMKTKLTTHGLVTPFFVETYLKQIYLFELNKVAKDYFGIHKVGE